jgi:AcrR family transcriptional regulator
MALTKRQQQAINTRRHIYKTAMRLFEEYNFDNVTIKQICHEANISVGAFYHYFEKKEDILVEQYRVIDRMFGDSIENLSSDSNLEKIVEFMNQYSQSAETDGVKTVNEVYRVWLTLRQGFPYIEGEGVTGGLKELLRRAQENGEIPRDVDIEEMMWDILIMVRGTIYFWCQQNGNFPLVQRTEKLTRQFLRGLR